MNEFNGPHFEPDLIGPDGKLSRLHKGGQHKANRLAAEANKEAAKARKSQAKTAAAQKKQAASLLKAQKASSAKENAIRKRELALSEKELDIMQAKTDADNTPEATYIDDRAATKRKRSAFGLSSTRKVGGFGLGGNSGNLG